VPRFAKLVSAIIVVGSALVAVACGGSSPAPAPIPTIAVVPKGSTHEFWKSVHAGALKAAAERHVNILWQGPIKEDDRESQIQLVDTLRSRGIQGLALAPLDDKALGVPVDDMVKAGVPVVVFDSDLASHNYISFIATDNFKGGQMAGEHMATLLGDKGGVVMLRLHEGSASTTAREEGFLDAIKKHPGITILSANQYGGGTADQALKVSENLLAATKAASGAVKGIFCPNESTTFGMLRALQGAKLAGKIKFVGFDSSEALVQALTSGELDALVLQDPVKMGYMSVNMLVNYLQKQPVEPRIDTGVTLVTKQNMNEPGVAALLKPDLSILEGKK
jgi:ribose transport system substrate-binding protein